MTTDGQQPVEGSMRSLIASTITENMQKAMAAQSQPETQPVQQPVQQPVPQQPAAPQVSPEVPPAPPAPPAEPPAVSTASVADLDIAAMFKTPVTEPPQAPAQLPPDTPVDAPPEIAQNEKARSAWEILRNRERESRHLAEQLRAQLADATKQAGAVAEERARFADELKHRDDHIHELEDKLGQIDLASRPEFRRQYDEQMESIAANFRDALKDAAEIDDDQELADTTKRLLSVSDSEFTRLVSKLPATAQGSLWDKRREFNSIASARASAIAEWRTAQNGVTETDKQRQVIAQAERRRTLAEQAIDFTNTQLTPDRRPTVLAEATYRADVESANQQFRGFMQVATDDELARVAYQGFLVPVMQRQVAYLAEALGKWRDAYYAIRGAGAPPAFPIRVQQSAPAAPVAPVAPAAITDRGGSFSNVVQDTLTDTIRRAVGR